MGILPENFQTSTDDPYWDEIISEGEGIGEYEKSKLSKVPQKSVLVQNENPYGGRLSGDKGKHEAPGATPELFDLQQCTAQLGYTPVPYWDSFDTSTPQNPNIDVREQVSFTTAPEHSTNCSRTHFVEQYWVQRGDKKYYYFRYIWMEGRKMRRRHLGSVKSPKALALMEKVRSAIALGKLPHEIVELW